MSCNLGLELLELVGLQDWKYRTGTTGTSRTRTTYRVIFTLLWSNLGMELLGLELHTKKSILNSVKSNWNPFVFTISRLISVWFNRISERFLCVYWNCWNDQACSCPRALRLLVLRGRELRAFLNPLECHSTLLSRGLWEDPSIKPPLYEYKPLLQIKRIFFPTEDMQTLSPSVLLPF